VLCGRPGLHRLDADGTRHGLLGRIIRLCRTSVPRESSSGTSKTSCSAATSLLASASRMMQASNKPHACSRSMVATTCTTTVDGTSNSSFPSKPAPYTDRSSGRRIYRARCIGCSTVRWCLAGVHRDAPASAANSSIQPAVFRLGGVRDEGPRGSRRGAGPLGGRTRPLDSGALRVWGARDCAGGTGRRATRGPFVLRL
jgi:hypothetical protein